MAWSRINKIKFKYQSEESLSTVGQWYIDKYQDELDEGAAFLSIIGDDPDGLAGVDSAKLKASMVGRSKAMRIIWSLLWVMSVLGVLFLRQQ